MMPLFRASDLNSNRKWTLLKRRDLVWCLKTGVSSSLLNSLNETGTQKTIWSPGATSATMIYFVIAYPMERSPYLRSGLSQGSHAMCIKKYLSNSKRKAKLRIHLSNRINSQVLASIYRWSKQLLQYLVAQRQQEKFLRASNAVRITILMHLLIRLQLIKSKPW